MARERRPNGEHIVVTRASEIKSRRQNWLWEPYTGQGVIPLGTATIVAGKGGEGKSTFVLHLISLLTRGTLPGDLHGNGYEAIIIGPEDDWDTVMVPRLIAADADTSKVLKVAVETVSDDYTGERSLSFPLDVDGLREVVEGGDVKLIVIDPAPSLMTGDTNKVQDVRKAYEPLIALAQKHELALVLLNHFGKGAGDVSAKLSGSHAWRDLTRSYLAFATDPDTGERIITQDKNNYSTSMGSYKFNLVSTEVVTDDGEVTNVARVDFLGMTDQTVNEIINRTPDTENSGDREEYSAFILDFLNNAGGECLVSEIEQAAKEQGLSIPRLRKIRMKMRNPSVTSQRTGFGPGSKFVWTIDEPSDAGSVISVDFTGLTDSQAHPRGKQLERDHHA